MNQDNSRLKIIVVVMVLFVVVGYGFLLVRLSFVPINSEQLEPEIRQGEMLAIYHREPVVPGDLVAFRAEKGTVIQRVFLEGPARVRCVRGSAVVDDRLIEFKRLSANKFELATSMTVKERWGSHDFTVIKSQQLLPYPLPTNQPDLVIEAGQLLAGCQNRAACGGCGFHRVKRSQIVGRVERAADIFTWN